MAKVAPTLLQDGDVERLVSNESSNKLLSPVVSARKIAPLPGSAGSVDSYDGGSSRTLPTASSTASTSDPVCMFTSSDNSGGSEHDAESKVATSETSVQANSGPNKVFAKRTVSESSGTSDDTIRAPISSPRKSAKLSPITGRALSEGSSVKEENNNTLNGLFAFLSTHINDLTSGNEATWNDFSTMTATVFNKAGTDSVAGNVRKVLIELGYSPLHGWRRNTVQQVSLMFQKFSTLYLKSSSFASQMSATYYRKDVGNLDALTFCPDSLFSVCVSESVDAPQLASEQLQAAVLIADISGFSKFAGRMCLQGAKGLDMLHKVTNEYLGRFVHAVYAHRGDGKLFLWISYSEFSNGIVCCV
jgi:hypothetical protein